MDRWLRPVRSANDEFPVDVERPVSPSNTLGGSKRSAFGPEEKQRVSSSCCWLADQRDAGLTSTPNLSNGHFCNEAFAGVSLLNRRCDDRRIAVAHCEMPPVAGGKVRIVNGKLGEPSINKR